MKQKSKSRRSNHKHPQMSATNASAQKAMRSHRQTARVAQRSQQRTVRDAGDLVEQTASAQNWQGAWRRLTMVTGSLIPVAQRQMQAFMSVVDTNNRNGAELIRLGLDAAQGSITPDGRDSWMELWTATMRAFKSNAEALSQATNRTVDSWVRFLRENAGGTPEPGVTR